MNTLFRYLGLLACAGVLCITAYFTLYELGAAPLELYDEGTYAQVVKESMIRGDFLNFTYEGKLFFDKPPLYFWLAGIATAVTGDEALGIRLPAALGAIALVFVVMCMAYAWTKSPWWAAASGTLLMYTPPFVEGARQARLDVLVSLFIMLALYAAWRGLRDDRWFLLMGVFIGLAVLSKSIIAIFAVAAIGLLLVLWRKTALVTNRNFLWGVVVSICTVAPWHAYETGMWGIEFWRQYIGFHVLERFEHNVFGDPALQTNYTAHLFWFAKLITGTTLLACVSVAMYWRALPKGPKHILMLIGAVAALMLVVFYASQTRAFSYLIPVYPFAAIFVSCAAAFLFSAARRA